MQQRKKILQFIASTQWGGAEKVFVELANHLSKKCDVHVLLLHGTDFIDRIGQQVNLIETSRQGSRRNLLLLFEIAKIIQQIQPDIIHTHASKATEMIYYLSKFLKFNQVATKHNARKGKIFNKIPWVTTVSEQARLTIKKQDQVEVIYNGIVPKVVGNLKKPPVFSIIAVGRLDSYKGFDVLIKEASKLPFDFVLNIVGEGSERKNLEKLIRDLKLERRVNLLGHREDVPELLKEAHLQVISSRTEGFSMVVAEGLFYSDVVLSTAVGIADEIMPSELITYDRDLAAGIETIHSNYNQYTEIFKKTADLVRHQFLIGDIVQNYLRLYSKILQEI